MFFDASIPGGWIVTLNSHHYQIPRNSHVPCLSASREACVFLNIGQTHAYSRETSMEPYVGASTSQFNTTRR
jgi:hypothetical protein